MNASPTGATGPSRHRVPPTPPAVDGSPTDLAAPAPATAAAAPPDRRRRRRWLAGLAVTAPLVLAGCNFYPSYQASKGVTTQGQDTFRLWSGLMTAGILVFLIVGGLILWSIIRYRRRSDAMPKQFHELIPLEIVYTTVPIVMVALIFAFTVITENRVDATVPASLTSARGEPVVDVTVTAFQWGWRFDYPRLNVTVVGNTTNGPNDHGPQMVLPEGEKTQITLVSDDVVHGFYVRDFNFSRYAQPGVTNVFDLDLVKTGTFNGQCTQFCGLYHSEMLFSVKSVSPSNFNAWVADEVAAGHTLKPVGNNAENSPSVPTHETPAHVGPTPSLSATPSALPKPKASA